MQSNTMDRIYLCLTLCELNNVSVCCSSLMLQKELVNEPLPVHTCIKPALELQINCVFKLGGVSLYFSPSQ